MTTTVLIIFESEMAIAQEVMKRKKNFICMSDQSPYKIKSVTHKPVVTNIKERIKSSDNPKKCAVNLLKSN